MADFRLPILAIYDESGAFSISVLTYRRFSSCILLIGKETASLDVVCIHGDNDDGREHNLRIGFKLRVHQDIPKLS